MPWFDHKVIVSEVKSNLSWFGVIGLNGRKHIQTIIVSWQNFGPQLDPRRRAPWLMMYCSRIITYLYK